MHHTSLYGPVMHGAMTVILSHEQYATWDLGNWDAYHVEQDILEQMDALGIRQPVVVLRPDGQTPAFGLTPPHTHRGQR